MAPLPLVPCYKCGKSLPPKDADGEMTCECGASDIDYRCERCGQEREPCMGCAPCDATDLARMRAALQTLRAASARYHGEATNAGAVAFPPYLTTAIEQADVALKEAK